MEDLLKFGLMIFSFFLPIILLVVLVYSIIRIFSFFKKIIITTIRKKKYDKWLKDEKLCEGYPKIECPICMEMGYLMTSECKHNSCRMCWFEVIKRFDICPFCRKKVDIHKLRYIKD